MSDVLNKVKQHNPQLAHSLQRSLEGIEQLEAITEQDAARIGEARFKRDLLPILVERSGEQDLTIWQEIAGHALRPIDVFDDQTGERLFRIPPLLRTLKREFTGRGRHSAYEILRTADQKSKVMPSLGDEHIRSRLTESVTSQPIDIEDIRSWNAILTRYGYEPMVEVSTSSDADEKQEQGELRDSFSGEYDDL